jgi:hypothetical protein
MIKTLNCGSMSVCFAKYCRKVLMALCFYCVANALPVKADPVQFSVPDSAFPIGVWMQSTGNAVRYRELGINTYVGLSDGLGELQLSTLARAGLIAIAEQNDVGLNSRHQDVVRAWMQPDEPDNTQLRGTGAYGPCIAATAVARRTQRIKAKDPTRPVFINFGPGMADTNWRGRGVCRGDTKYYDVAIKDADILSFDIYPINSDIPEVIGKLEYVAKGITNLLQHAGPRQAAWTVLETTAIGGGRGVRPFELRAELWMAVIHGASGILYFVHEFSPQFREDAVFRYPDIVREITAQNRLLQRLAPVLRQPALSDEAHISSAIPIASLVKRYEDGLYVFTVLMRNERSSAQFVLPHIAEAQAEVIGEDRIIKVSSGRFSDDYEPYGVHLYRVRSRSE